MRSCKGLDLATLGGWVVFKTKVLKSARAKGSVGLGRVRTQPLTNPDLTGGGVSGGHSRAPTIESPPTKHLNPQTREPEVQIAKKRNFFVGV